ncbi:MAG: hypothetical protein ABSB23_01125 [Bryobacteraceae bacterium]|jgi:hypothetical protein
MFSPELDFDKFVAAVKDLPLIDITESIALELRAAKPGRESARYCEMLRGLRYLLDTGQRPSNVEDWEFAKLRPVVESLVSRGTLLPSALDVFISR